MVCSNKNLLVNSKFRRGLSPWTGGNIKIVKNPMANNDLAVLMNAMNPHVSSVLKQTVYGPLEQGCAYYLFFRVMNLTPSPYKARLFATVSYLDDRGDIIRSTPLLILFPELTEFEWVSYFTIVPPPPGNVHHTSVVMLLAAGKVLVDNIVLSSRQV